MSNNTQQLATGRFGRSRTSSAGGTAAPLPIFQRTPLASFRAAILEARRASSLVRSPAARLLAGADPSDVHITSDGVVVMFHDPTLDRTTNGTGTIRSQPWTDVIESVPRLRTGKPLTPGRHVRTVKEPVQPIPLFEQLVALLMEPDNQHIILNVSTASRTAYRETG